MKPKLVSIVIVNYNGMKFLPSCLDSVQSITYGNFEIVVVDNGSADGSNEFMVKYSRKHANTHYYGSKTNVGLAKAQNIGAKLSRGEYLLFLNNDTLVDMKIVDMLVSWYPDYKGVLGCRMGDYDGTRELDSFISCDRFGYPTGTTSSMFYPDGAIFITTSVFKEIGGFDEKLFLYGEDRDLCWRVLLAGYTVLPCTGAIFYHASSCVYGTTYFRRKVAEKNLIRSMLKNYSWRSLCLILPQYFLLSVAELLFLTLTGNLKAVLISYLPAYYWNLVNIRSTMAERSKVQATRRVPDSHIRKIMSKEIGKLFVLKKFGVPKFAERTTK